MPRAGAMTSASMPYVERTRPATTERESDQILRCRLCRFSVGSAASRCVAETNRRKRPLGGVWEVFLGLIQPPGRVVAVDDLRARRANSVCPATAGADHDVGISNGVAFKGTSGPEMENARRGSLRRWVRRMELRPRPLLNVKIAEFRKRRLRIPVRRHESRAGKCAQQVQSDALQHCRAGVSDSHAR